jgi:hypothetical protein
LDEREEASNKNKALNMRTVTELNFCPQCNTELNVTEGEGIPEPGNVSICWHCGAILIFLEDLRLRLMTFEEYSALDQKHKDTIEFFRFVARNKPQNPTLN